MDWTEHYVHSSVIVGQTQVSLNTNDKSSPFMYKGMGSTLN